MKKQVKNERERVLLVDDDEFVLRAVRMGLERFGYNVVCHADPIQALNHFEKNPDAFQMVISDVAMPRMTGLEFVGRLKDQKNDVPVILCTGQSDDMDGEKAERIGVGAFVQKPIRLKELAGIMRSLMDKGKERTS